MSSTMAENPDFLLKLRELEHLDNNRKSLIRLALIRAKTLYSSGPKSEPKSASESPAPVSSSDMQKKVLDYERRCASLKSQLATKDQVHEAKIDGFKQLISRLQSQLEAQTRADPPKKVKKNAARTFSSPSAASNFGSSSFFSPARTSSAFNFPSPFAAKTGKGNSFVGINSSIASQASLKLSKGKDEEVFSPNNSSAETTPKKSQGGRAVTLEDARSGNLNRALMKLSESDAKNAPEKSATTEADTDADAGADQSDASHASTRPNESSDSELKGKDGSDSEDTFQSANGTFVETRTSNRNTKKKRIRLFSSEASKILVESQSKLNDEDADPNSLGYYDDDNFKDDLVSPTRPLKRSMKEERTDKATKKRHVFKI